MTTTSEEIQVIARDHMGITASFFYLIVKWYSTKTFFLLLFITDLMGEPVAMA